MTDSKLTVAEILNHRPVLKDALENTKLLRFVKTPEQLRVVDVYFENARSWSGNSAHLENGTLWEKTKELKDILKMDDISAGDRVSLGAAVRNFRDIAWNRRNQVGEAQLNTVPRPHQVPDAELTLRAIPYTIPVEHAFKESKLDNFELSIDQRKVLETLYEKLSILTPPKLGKRPDGDYQVARVNLEVGAWTKLEKLDTTDYSMWGAFKEFCNIAVRNARLVEAKEAKASSFVEAVTENRPEQHANLAGKAQFELAKQLVNFAPEDEVVNGKLSASDAQRHAELEERLFESLLHNPGMDSDQARAQVDILVASGIGEEKTRSGRTI